MGITTRRDGFDSTRGVFFPLAVRTKASDGADHFSHDFNNT